MLSHTTSDILLIITDQQRWDATGYVTPWVLTPNIDRLASKSVVCSNTYVQSPQCQPSRASLMTGRYPTAHKVWWNSIDLPKSEKTLGNYLKEAGYNTAFFGKAHFSENDQRDIKYFGFDESFLFEDWLKMDIQRVKGKKPPRREYGEIMGSPHWAGRLSDRRVHHEDVITDKAMQWLRNHNHPKLTVVSFVGPHPPYAAPPPYSEFYDKSKMTAPKGKTFNMFGKEISREQWLDLKTQYYGMVSWIDDNIGRLIEAIRHNSNTLVIFTSDHGDILGDHGMFSKGLFAYEGNTRVPMLFHHRDLKARKYEHLVQSIDIVPTILGHLGIGAPAGIQGKNLLPHFKSGSSANDYALSMIGHEERIRMVRSGSLKYWVNDRGEEYMFDLQNDPHERNNLAHGDHRGDLNRMRKKLLLALISAEDTMPLPTR